MSDKVPQFTVFTPSFNRAATLLRLYESLKVQTLRGFEWILIDDGSTDNTRQLVESWAEEADFPIRYVWQDNASKAAAWNRALELARGKFFVCLDSDDRCVPESLASFKEHWESIPAEEQHRFSGITALALDQDGEPYGPDLPTSPLDGSHLAVTYRLKRKYDSWQCYRTEVIKAFPFELIPGYRNYLPETTVINRVARFYIQRHVNQRLLVVHTAELQDAYGHQSCGLTAKAGLKHAPGLRAANLSLLNHQMRWLPYAMIEFYKVAANYIRFSWMQGISGQMQIREIDSMCARALWLAALPAAVVLRMSDRSISRQKRLAQAKDRPRTNVFYISYDGLMEPLGQSQVLPYLRGLSCDYAITVLSFEKPRDLADAERCEAAREAMRKSGIEWIALRYHKRLSTLATAFDIVNGIVRSELFALRRHPRIIHLRGYVPGAIGLALKKLTGARLIFDMRGFWPDEKVDGGAWRPDSAVYRTAKWLEKYLLRQADVVVSLTHAGVTAMREFPYLQGREVRYEVIPTCADLELFKPTNNQGRRKGSEFVLGYVGSVGTFYLFDEVLKCFKDLLKVRPDAKLLIVNRGGHGYIRERLTALAVPKDKVELRVAEYREVPDYINRLDAGAFFIKPTHSKKASAPTRLGEFLGCGVPCLVNSGVGDLDSIVSSDQVGVVMEDFSPKARSAAVHELLRISAENGIEMRCVDAARRRFALQLGVTSYRSIYSELLERSLGRESKKWNTEAPRVEYDGN